MNDNFTSSFDGQPKAQNRTKNVVLLNGYCQNNLNSTRSSLEQASPDSIQLGPTLHNKLSGQAYTPQMPSQQADYRKTLYSDSRSLTFTPLARPTYNKSVNYYQEFWRMYLNNELLITQMKEVLHCNKEVERKIHNLNVHTKIVALSYNSIKFITELLSRAWGKSAREL